MNTNIAKVSLTSHQATFELSGSEEFVSRELAHFKEAIAACLTQAKPSAAAHVEKTAAELPAPAPHSAAITNENTFPRVLHFEKDDVKIIKAVSGSNTAKKAVNTALIYLWAKRSKGTDSVEYAEIRKQCKDQGCLDSDNFSGTMRNARQWIIVEGEGKSQSCKLTLPGVEQAEQILKDLNGEQS